MLTAVVLARNEESNIGQCLTGLSFSDEILVLDNDSGDNTASLASRLGANVIPVTGDFAQMRNIGLEKARGDWVLFVDADERVSRELALEIKAVMDKNEKQGYRLKRDDYFMGRLLRYGETASVRLVRLAKKNSGSWQGKVHETWQVKGKTDLLKNALIHQKSLTLAAFLAKINTYSDARAKDLYETGTGVNIVSLFIYPLGKFFQNYILRLGFADGIPGFIMAGMMSLHSFMVRAKLFILRRNCGRHRVVISDWEKHA